MGSRSRFFAATALSVLALGLAGCDPMERLQAEWRALLIVATGAPSPLERPRKRAAAPDKTKAQAELLHELFRVALLKEPQRTEFADYLYVMEQGASLEGLYNGFTHSTDYRRLEAGGDTVKEETLQRFSEALATLSSELPVPTQFGLVDAGALPTIDPYELGEGPKPVASGRPRGRKDLEQEYRELFQKSSVFTMKRILGDEALKVIASKWNNRPELARWYAKWVVELAQKKVDFGLELRNKADEEFHLRWAIDAPEDRFKWEVLNRVHRLLNDSEKRVALHERPK